MTSPASPNPEPEKSPQSFEPVQEAAEAGPVATTSRSKRKRKSKKSKKREKVQVKKDDKEIIKSLFGVMGVVCLILFVFIFGVVWSKHTSRPQSSIAPSVSSPPLPNPSDRAIPPASAPQNLSLDDASNAPRSSQPILQTDEEIASTKEQLADTEFAAKHYEAARNLYREILTLTNRKPLQYYRIFVCLLLEGKKTDAMALFAKFPPPPQDASPLWSYASATMLFLDGKSAEARALIDKARQTFPALCPRYDPTLQALGFEVGASSAPSPSSPHSAELLPAQTR